MQQVAKQTKRGEVKGLDFFKILQLLPVPAKTQVCGDKPKLEK